MESAARLSKRSGLWDSSFITLLWIIWKERNTRCFVGKGSNLQALAEKLKFIVADGNALISWILSRSDHASSEGGSFFNNGYMILVFIVWVSCLMGLGPSF